MTTPSAGPWTGATRCSTAPRSSPSTVVAPPRSSPRTRRAHASSSALRPSGASTRSSTCRAPAPSSRRASVSCTRPPPCRRRERLRPSKATAEQYVRALQDEGAPITITYPGGVGGPPAGSAFGELGDSIVTILRLGMLPLRDGSISVVDVRDVGAVHAAAMKPGRGRAASCAAVTSSRCTSTQGCFRGDREVLPGHPVAGGGDAGHRPDDRRRDPRRPDRFDVHGQRRCRSSRTGSERRRAPARRARHLAPTPPTPSGRGIRGLTTPGGSRRGWSVVSPPPHRPGRTHHDDVDRGDLRPIRDPGPADRVQPRDRHPRLGRARRRVHPRRPHRLQRDGRQRRRSRRDEEVPRRRDGDVRRLPAHGGDEQDHDSTATPPRAARSATTRW